jgi:hypothetical protein
MKEPKDKRTKAHKEWKAQQSEEVISNDEAKLSEEDMNVSVAAEPLFIVSTEPKQEKLGLGDVVESVTKATGIKAVVKKLFGDDCGCKERKEKLNNFKLPIRRSAKRCFTKEQYNQFKEYTKRRTLKSWDVADQQMLIDLYAHVFALQYNIKNLCTNCSGAGRILLQMDKDLEIVYNSYDK